MDVSIEQQGYTRPQSYTYTDPRVGELATGQGYHVSWQRTDDMSIAQIEILGIRPLTTDQFKSWDPELFKELVGPSKPLRVKDGFIRRGDTALCIQSHEAREREEERQRYAKELRNRQAAGSTDEVESAVRKVLAEMGHTTPKPMVQVARNASGGPLVETATIDEGVSVQKAAADDPLRKRPKVARKTKE